MSCKFKVGISPEPSRPTLPTGSLIESTRSADRCDKVRGMSVSWISSFLLMFSGGTLLFTASVPRREIGARFYRVNAYVALFLAISAVLSSRKFDHWPMLSYAGAVLALSVLGQAGWFRAHVPVYVVLSAGAVAAAMAGGFSWGGLVSTSLSSLVLGGGLVCMLLGHSYLESDNQSFDLLIDACRALLFALALRGAAAAAMFIPDAGRVAAWMDVDFVLVLFTIVRFLVGILCAGILAWMSLACAKIKSNQSATGILYVVLGFVIIGELVAAYIGMEKGVGL